MWRNSLSAEYDKDLLKEGFDVNLVSHTRNNYLEDLPSDSLGNAATGSCHRLADFHAAKIRGNGCNIPYRPLEYK